VRDDENVVARRADVELQRGDADRERGCEGRDRVLRREPSCPAMPLNVEGAGGRGDAEEKRRQSPRSAPPQGQISISLKK
jgi:hypothetical protein